MKLIPNHIKNKLSQKPYLNKIINNIGWLFFDKIFRMGVGLFIGAWMARYLGPEQLGLLNYVLAIISFLVVIAGFGLNSITVKELVNEPKLTNIIMGSTFFIQTVTSVLAFLILLLLTFILFTDHTSKVIAIVIGFSLLFKASDVIRYFFESHTQSKYIVWSENCSFVICTLLKIILILCKASLFAIASIFLLDAFIISSLILFAYLTRKQQITTWKIDLNYIKKIIKQCWPLILSGLTIMLYMRIDQVMLGQMLNYEAVGLYTAATKISEIWYFIPMIIVSSIAPTLIKEKTINEHNYFNKLKLILNTLTLISIAIAFTVSIFSSYIIYILYGEQYQASANVLIIHMWTGIFVSMGIITSQYLIIQNLQILSLYRTLFGAIINILLNFLLIPMFGILGAALATLIAQISVNLLYDLLDKRLKRLFWIKINSINILYSIKMIFNYIRSS